MYVETGGRHNDVKTAWLPNAMNVEVVTDHYPKLTLWHVRRVLKWIHPADLVGLTAIRLLGESPSELQEGNLPTYLTGRFNPGRYEKTRKLDSYVNLYTKSLYVGIPSPLTLTPAATLRIAYVLAHEVGHHLIVRKGHIHSPSEKYKAHGRYDLNKEAMADSYAYSVIRRMSASPYYKIGQWLSRSYAHVCYELGYVAYKRQDYKRAARYFFVACCNNPADSEAERAYHTAIQLIDKRLCCEN